MCMVRSPGELGLHNIAGYWSAAEHKSVDSDQEALDTFYPLILPIEFAIRRGGEQRVHAGTVSAIALDHLIRRDNVAQAFGHFCSALDDHALSKEAFCRFIVLDQSHIAHEFSPEARINEMQNGVFNPADILIDSTLSKPIAALLAVERRLIILSIGVAVEIPLRINE